MFNYAVDFLAKVHLKEFRTESKSDLELLNNVVSKLIQQSGFEGNCEYIHLPSSLRMLYFATNGRISYIAAIIGESLRLANSEKTKTLSSEHFENAFASTVWADAIAKTNPFSGNFIPRELVGSGEPFFAEVA